MLGAEPGESLGVANERSHNVGHDKPGQTRTEYAAPPGKTHWLRFCGGSQNDAVCDAARKANHGKSGCLAKIGFFHRFEHVGKFAVVIIECRSQF